MDKLMEIIDRLIISGLDETEAICLIGSFLETEAPVIAQGTDQRHGTTNSLN